MVDSQAHMISQRVQQYQASPEGRTLNIIKPQDFEQILRYVCNSCGISGEVNSELRLIVALCWLGPPSLDPPPPQLSEELWRILQEEISEEKDRRKCAVDIILAYGCGNWRHVCSDADGWAGRWQPACNSVTRYIAGWMKATAAWLHFDINLKGYALKEPPPSYVDAEELARLLWMGKCDCWRLRSSTGEEVIDHRARSRQERCFREHRLSAWNPAEISLSDFLARAVKGDKPKGDLSRQKSFVVGAVVQGMFFCDLYRNHEVRLGKVLLWRCPRHPQKLFEGFAGSQCLLCRDEDNPLVFDEVAHKREGKPRFFISLPKGPYQKESFWHCQHCQNYYEAKHNVDPFGKCQKRRVHGAAKSTMWVFSGQTTPIKFRDDIHRSSTATVDTLHTSNDLETELLRKEKREHLIDALAHLPEEERTILEMIAIQDYSRKEASQRLQKSVAEVDRLFSHAKRKMRTFMVEEES